MLEEAVGELLLLPFGDDVGALESPLIREEGDKLRRNQTHGVSSVPNDGDAVGALVGTAVGAGIIDNIGERAGDSVGLAVGEEERLIQTQLFGASVGE